MTETRTESRRFSALAPCRRRGRHARLRARPHQERTEAGKANGAWLKPRLPGDCLILVSPAKRAQQTAAALDLPYTTEQAIGVHANIGDIVAAVSAPRHKGAVLVVGHQPTLGRLAARLLAGDEADWTIKKGALWWFSNRAGEFILRAVDQSRNCSRSPDAAPLKPPWPRHRAAASFPGAVRSISTRPLHRRAPPRSRDVAPAGRPAAAGESRSRSARTRAAADRHRCGCGKTGSPGAGRTPGPSRRGSGSVLQLGQLAAVGERQPRQLRLLHARKPGHVGVGNDIGRVFVVAVVGDGNADLVQVGGPGEHLFRMRVGLPRPADARYSLCASSATRCTCAVSTW